jgi:hypothetical protein
MANKPEHNPRRGNPDRHVPASGREGEQSRQHTLCMEREKAQAGPPPRLNRCREPEVGAEDERPEGASSEVSRKKHHQRDGETEENREGR